MAYGAILGQNTGNVLWSDLNYYVDSNNGSDTTGDGSQSNPFQTIQYAINLIPNNLNGHLVTINIASGTYEGFTAESFDFGQISFIGVNSEGAVNITSSVTLGYRSSANFTLRYLTFIGTNITNKLIQFYNTVINFDNSWVTGVTNASGAENMIEASLGSQIRMYNVRINQCSFPYLITANQLGFIAANLVTGSGNNGIGFFVNGGGIISRADNCTMQATTDYYINSGGQLFGSVGRTFLSGTSDMTAGTTALATGTIYLMYE